MQDFIAQLAPFKDAMLDPFVVVDVEGNILEFNRRFYDLFPKTFARKLKDKTLNEVVLLELDQSEDLDVISVVLERQRPVQYENLKGYFTDAQNLPVSIGAAPVGQHGVLIIFRDASDLAAVQSKYQHIKAASGIFETQNED